MTLLRIIAILMVPGDAIWHHFGTVFPEVCRERLFGDFWVFLGARGSRHGAPGVTLGHPNFEGNLLRKPASVGDPEFAASGGLKGRLAGPKPTNHN